MNRSFSAKIILFGEHSVVRGGQALAIPFTRFAGEWVTEGAPKAEWNPLIRFLVAHPELEIDVARLEKDLSRGGGFISDIPQGKGLGSSGALVAGLLTHYGPDREWSVQDAQKRLASLEAYYHGQSSGIDPLVSWRGKPFLITGTEVKEVAVPVTQWQGLDRWFLFDSGVARHSAPLIAVFKRKTEDPAFAQSFGDLKALVDEAIESYEHLDEVMMGVTMRALSKLQLECMSEMIPSGLREIWAQGLASGEFALKLCGAGGGGFFTGYRLKSYPREVLKF